jgi:putative protease
VKILCPVDSAAEAAELSALGARELYGGYCPPTWAEQFALAAPPNRRTFAEAQIADAAELREVIAAAHAGGAEFFLAVNSPVYAAGQHPALFALVEEALDAGADALIAADPGFIVGARSRWPGVRTHLSTLADAGNHGAVAFWRRLGVERITLPRHLPLALVEALVAASPGARFDAFVLYGQCPNDEGQCTFSHDHPGRVWPCVQRYRIEPAGDSEPARRAADAQRGWGGLSRADACGLCSLWDLERLGVAAAKIVGRGTPTARKSWAVRTVAGLLGLIDAGIGREEFRAAARERSLARFAHGCSPYLCYFPECIPPSPTTGAIPLDPPLPKGDQSPSPALERDRKPSPHPAASEGNQGASPSVKRIATGLPPPSPKGEEGGLT